MYMNHNSSRYRIPPHCCNTQYINILENVHEVEWLVCRNPVTCCTHFYKHTLGETCEFQLHRKTCVSRSLELLFDT